MRRIAAIGLLALLVGCDPPGFLLLVNVRTDLQPGAEFQEVSVELVEPARPGDAGAGRFYAVSPEDDFLPGVTQVAAIADLPPGPLTARVSLLHEGRPRLTRNVRLMLDGPQALVVLLTRSCESLVCPQDGDDPEATECLGNACVDPRCTPDTPEHCPVPCAADADCVDAVAPCHDAQCVEGACYGRPRCVSGEYCHASGDCEPTLCRDASPEDAVPCGEFDEVCVDGACRGPCTDRPEGASCGENGEACTMGACVGPCTGQPEGTPCGGPDEVCTADGACLGPCTGRADGERCGATSRTSWTSCRYDGPCDDRGQRSRTVTTYACEAEVCVRRRAQETDRCDRTVQNGKSCGGRWRRCCSGSCVDLRDDRNCGACRVNCRSEGLRCQGTGTGGYSCRRCATTPQCQRLLNGAATCWPEGGDGCECQCGSNGVCRGGGCGRNFYCHDCPGRNFCAPFGGGC